jgi:hypothetical protein
VPSDILADGYQLPRRGEQPGGVQASLTKNPAASSRSSPGVRIVMTSAVPFTLIPSGSSPASRSA